MRIFSEFPSVAMCPICKTNNQGETILIPIDGTYDKGNCEATPVHTACLFSGRLHHDEDVGILYIKL